MRRLPIYFLIDVSESMVGEPIQQVEAGLKSIVRDLRSDPYALETVHASVIVFAGKAEVLTPLADITVFDIPSIPIGSGTSLASGLNALMRDMDREVRPTTREQKGDWKPVVFLFTDGTPTDNTDAAIEKWNSKYGSACNMVIVTFGDNSDIALLERLKAPVFAMKDMGSQSFREFFKWVSASIKVSSVAACEDGKEDRTGLTGCICLEKADSSQTGSPDDNFAILPARCGREKKTYLIKYAASGENENFELEGAYPINGETYKKLGGGSVSAKSVNSDLLSDIPDCPYCGNATLVHCGSCSRIFCGAGGKTVVCPWCGNEGTLGKGASLDLSRTLG